MKYNLNMKDFKVYFEVNSKKIYGYAYTFINNFMSFINFNLFIILGKGLFFKLFSK